MAHAEKANKDMYEWYLNKLKDDPNQQNYYSKANNRLKPPAVGEQRVVFIGDSITERWKLDSSFPNKSYINRGICVQTTSQMLARFNKDVINLQPKAVVILAGTNDIAVLHKNPDAHKIIKENLAVMAKRAHEYGIKVIMASVLPTNTYTEPAIQLNMNRPNDKIIELNQWIEQFCEENNFTYLDYNSHMLDGQGYLRYELADDGLHPNKAGYKIMAPLAQKAIYDNLM